MDTTKTITHVGLCAGYGGIELGLKRVLQSLRTVALCEIEAFAIANLVAKMEAGLMDPAPIWTDLKTFPWESFRDRVDILTGGYPCQPFSAAGKRRGTEDDRHLWPYIASGIRLLRPRLCFFENVEGHISLGLREVIAELGSLGYQTAWGIFSAAECGAPHQRKRVFIMAVASSIGSATGLSGSLAGNEGKSGVADNCGAQDIWPSRPGEPQHAWEPPRVVGNTEQQHDGGTIRAHELQSRPGRIRACWESLAETDGESGQAEPPLGRDADGPAGGMDDAELCVTYDNRTDELRLLGNGVVPATASLAFQTLLDTLFINAHYKY